MIATPQIPEACLDVTLCDKVFKQCDEVTNQWVGECCKWAQSNIPVFLKSESFLRHVAAESWRKPGAMLQGDISSC